MSKFIPGPVSQNSAQVNPPTSFVKTPTTYPADKIPIEQPLVIKPHIVPVTKVDLPPPYYTPLP